MGYQYPEAPKLCPQVAGSSWRLTEDGKPVEVGSQEPQFSSWDDIFKERQAGNGGAAPSDSTGGSGSGKAANVGSDRVSSAGRSAGVVDDTYYR